MHLPRETALRPKSGFPVPFGKWLMADSRRESVEELLFGRNAATLFDIGLLRRAWDACLAGVRAELQIIFTVYVFVITRQDNSTDGRTPRKYASSHSNTAVSFSDLASR